MSIFRALLMQKKGGLPSGVVLYDRLVGDGTAYIESLPFNSSYDYEMEVFNLPNYTNFWGWRESYGGKFYALATTNSTEIRLYRNNNNAFTNVGGLGLPTLDRKISISWTKGTIVVVTSDGVTKNATFTPVEKDIIGGNARLFGMRGYSAAVVACGYKSYIVKDENGNILVNLRPCTYNGVAGMWDMVNNRFYGNANTSGSFSVSND